MDEKLLEALEQAIKLRTESLNKDKTGLEAEIQKEASRSFEKTYIQIEFETDLAKVEQELSMVNGDDEQLKALIEKENEENSKIEKAKLAIESLNKDMKALEAEIEKLQGTYELEDGKFKKNYVLESYEAELAKVTAELTQKEQAISTSQAGLETVQEEFKTLTAKYNIKEAEDKEVEQGEPAEEERAKQEEEMWKEWEAEQNKNAYTPEQVDMEIDEAYEERNNAAEPTEPKTAQQAKPATEKQVKPETMKQQPATPKQQPATAKQAKPENAKPQATTQKQRPVTNQPKNTSELKQWEVTNVTFFITNSNEPCYRVSLVNGKEVKQEEFKGLEYLKALDAGEENALSVKENINGAKKYYDKGLASVLEKIDAKYGTAGLEQYKKMLKNRKQIRKNPSKYSKEILDLDYNFSELFTKLNDANAQKNIKALKKLANANYKMGLATYEKAPNFLQRLWRKITTKQIATEIKTQESWKDTMFKHYTDECNTPGFDEKLFVSEAFRSEGLSEQDKKDLVGMINNYHKTFANKREEFQSDLKSGATGMSTPKGPQTNGTPTESKEQVDGTSEDKIANEVGRVVSEVLNENGQDR